MNDIDQAIRQRLEIEFEYHGHHRVVQPAAHGVHVSTGREVLRAYQVGGTSSTRVPPLWDLFAVDQVEHLRVTDRTFLQDPPSYSRGDKHMGQIFEEL